MTYFLIMNPKMLRSYPSIDFLFKLFVSLVPFVFILLPYGGKMNPFASSENFPTLARQREFQDLWGRAISHLPVAENDSLVYVQAQLYAGENIYEDGRLPVELYTGIWYSITAYNPMGELVPLSKNLEANEELERDLHRLNPKPLRIIKTKSMDQAGPETWSEEGFTLRFPDYLTPHQERQILELGAKYRQAAMYRFQADLEGTNVIQSVVPCFPELSMVASRRVVVRVHPPAR
eukprot:TRINITY_DN1627_c0_g1::TRINITY_DN1627_c0_g1_i1::g.17648::m.17648 TRINITY_DN1627_c0_g1::TRINITY_DN1627_c0_g1_i1::g.17648  ORF type:complete len:249 (+),score=9.70,DUF3293/PF11697.3/5e-10 TRINITY_DN1627_c0_g1_i1:47-748(+)